MQVAVLLTGWLCIAPAGTILATELQDAPQACTYHTDDASSVLFFAIEAHASVIAGYVDECRQLGSSESNTVENHITYWRDGIQPAVISMKDHIEHLARFDQLPPWKREMVWRIQPLVAAIKERTHTVISLLAGSRESQSHTTTERSYAELLNAVLQDAQQVVREIEVLWSCGEVRAEVLPDL